MNPYLAGVGIGLVLLAAFVLVGRGLGASGAFSSVVASSVRAAAPAHGAGNVFYDDYARPLLSEWLVLEVIGIIIGAFVSAAFARRLFWAVERGLHSAVSSRLWFAFAGGVTMGLGAKLARGCTSGLGLTGGALLSVGSWLFIIAAFASAYAVAPLIRRVWQ
jgi:uncharacterized membrane protein YedE/YeeE